MQKQKIDPYYLIITSDYTSVSCGLYQAQNILDSFVEHKITASKNLMLHMVTLLKNNTVSWDDLSFIGVNCGPSPFTTLRVVITTVNGLLFAQKIPLIGIDGLQSFLYEYDSCHHLVVALLNAFNNDIYFGIKEKNGAIKTGWDFYATFLHELSEKQKDEPILFVGNGVTLHHELITTLFAKAIIPQPIPETVSLATVARISLIAWHEGKQNTDPLIPLYLKTLEYKQST